MVSHAGRKAQRKWKVQKIVVTACQQQSATGEAGLFKLSGGFFNGLNHWDSLGIALQDTKDVGYNMQVVLERLQFVRRRKEEAEVDQAGSWVEFHPEIRRKIRQKRYEAVDEKA